MSLHLICKMWAPTLQAARQIHLLFSNELEAERLKCCSRVPTLTLSSTRAFHRCLNSPMLPTKQLSRRNFTLSLDWKSMLWHIVDCNALFPCFHDNCPFPTSLYLLLIYIAYINPSNILSHSLFWSYCVTTQYVLLCAYSFNLQRVREGSAGSASDKEKKWVTEDS